MDLLRGSETLRSPLTIWTTAALTKYFLFVADFESFDLPEEHQIAQLPLNGVPLMILEEERELEKLLHLGPPSPLKIPPPPWESSKWTSVLLEGPQTICHNTSIMWEQSCVDGQPKGISNHLSNFRIRFQGNENYFQLVLLLSSKC